MNELTLKEKDLIKKYLRLFNPLHSCYSLSSIYLWNNCLYTYKFKLKDDILFLSENLENNTNSRLIFPVSQKEITPHELYKYAVELDYKYYFYVIERYVKKYKNDLERYFNIHPQSDYDDYVYLSYELSNLKGSKYSSKRNLISQFEKNYNGVYELKLIDDSNKTDIINLVDNLDGQMDVSLMDEMYECEKYGIKKAMELWSDLNLFGYIIYIDKKVKGFVIGSLLNRNTVIMNFRKATKRIKGIYQFLDREFARYVYSMGFKYINKESDLGNSNLRKAKESYYPVFKVKSFILELK